MTEPTHEEDEDEKEHGGAADAAGHSARDDAWTRHAITAGAAAVAVAVAVAARTGGDVASPAIA